MKFFNSLIALGCFCFSTFIHADLLNINPATVEAESWTILDTQTGQIIAEHNGHAQRAPASLTKMMTAYIALKEIKAGRLNVNEVITATPIVSIVQPDESQMFLKPGEKISVDQLLAGLIVMSANDAAVSLAEKISGSLPAFVERMNQEAKAIGMQNTHFANPAGITMDQHFSSAHDLALLGETIVKQTPEYLSYSKQPSFSYKNKEHHATNLVLKLDPSSDGMKTGFTKAAGYNLALTAHRPNSQQGLAERRLMVVVMGTKSAEKRAEVAYRLLDLAFYYTRNQVGLEGKQLIAELPVNKATSKLYKVETKQSQLVTTSLYSQANAIDLGLFDLNQHKLMQANAQGLMTTIAPNMDVVTHMNVALKQKDLTAPLDQTMQLAQVNIYQGDQLLQSFDIEDQVHIEESTWYQRFWGWLQEKFPFLA
ncbi:D-alanyl-D-alanine carboxypeptidase family protein [Acinetobacter rudis]|uniref:D-alanyl-D-alanine carboxypeptidase family protein n=1 Tax=Acinetobacter rudis TaxID=632955 RepID=A0AAW8J823_9GAMM|nr:D-alanyl-D-alanine carboxypeptidase family protein [Acinetobacter rudis]MDQ8934720.1 D-alanyl-D-alanine carboxypeptidase family protein [Acinetobacter rudis]MDQ9017199.1 D-alanyl-D-alanine carboxypeptidase family protein [Acinetobacter rudis]